VSRPLQFWFEFGSTYSYPAAMRVEADSQARGVELAWRPFLLGPIFAKQGLNDSPFNLNPAKGTYMWRDLERVCRDLGLPLRRPSVFPRNGLHAARVACANEEADWLPGFVRGVYTANFVEDRDPADREVLASILEGLGQPPGPILDASRSDEAKAKLRRRTEQAAAHGLFGAPSFRVAGELYWGNDRLEMALDHAAS
jgi:2-hydroxychromene-2-carboxylate isomerase